MAYRSAWTMENHSLITYFKGSSRAPSEEDWAGIALPSPFIDIGIVFQKGDVKHLSNRGERTLDSNPALTPIACAFHCATQGHL